ncbi:MAG: type 4a pilus biogenesis protein PilO, partial [Terriglobia bacterium]
LVDRFMAQPWYIQLLIYILIATVVVYGLQQTWPIAPATEERDTKAEQRDQLQGQVARLRDVEQRHQEFLTRLEALEEQLARLQRFVPTEKQTDDFMRLLQSSSMNTQVAMRRLTARNVVFREFYAEMPFEVELDGAYYDVMEFYQRLSQSARIINAGTIRLAGVDPSDTRFDYSPQTSVAGVCTVTAYYIPSEAELASAAPPDGAAR